MSGMNPTNLSKFYTKFNEFRVAEKFTDVTIECGNTKFNCHRVVLSAASEYFYFMFSGDFEERALKNADIRYNISAEVFSEVLRYIYTGNLIITSANMFALLEAGEMLRLRGVEELCVDFLRKNKALSVSTILDLFIYACRIRKQKIVELLTDDIAEDFRIFSARDRFLQTSFNELTVILKKTLESTPALESSPVDADMLFGVIVRWILYDRCRRLPHFDDLFRYVNQFGSISPEMIKVTMYKLMEMAPPADANVLSGNIYSTVLGRGEPRRACGPTENSMYVYAKLNGEDSVRIFLTDNANDWTVAGEIPDMTGANRWTRSAAVGSHHLYTLLYNRRTPGWTQNGDQLFYACTTSDLQSRFSLKAPPVIFEDVSLCAMRNNRIYAYNQTLSTRVLLFNTFSSEEIGSGIYMYHCELDRWFPVPAMRETRVDACMTVHDDVLYVIGGRNPMSDSTEDVGFAEQYDCRVGRWHSMPSAMFNRIGADCCVHADQIYLIGGVGGAGRLIEAYEFARNSWAFKTAMCAYKTLQYHRIISRNKELWGMGSFDEKNPAGGNLSVSIFDTNSCGKRTSFTLAEAAENTLGKNKGLVLDAVLFE